MKKEILQQLIASNEYLSEFKLKGQRLIRTTPVSYTHLTLPTILRV